MLAVLLGVAATVCALCALLSTFRKDRFERIYYVATYTVLTAGMTVALFRMPVR